ncbi:MAG: family 20 glycosylhydrolase [Spirochaetota bacterium]
MKKNRRSYVRCFHLDLKGLPPTAKRLMKLLDLLHAAKYNAILVEWEDMFPWTVDERFRCETAYSIAEVKRFAAKAKRLGIELIPLVQCLGHMEMVLRHKRYARMQEVAGQNDAINPLAPGAADLIRDMVRDVLSVIPDVRYFHLGGDEAWTFGTHKDTRAYIKKHGASALYIDCLKPLLSELNGRGIRPILWHDMMVDWDANALRTLGTLADLCVWGYSPYDRKKRPWLHPLVKGDTPNPWPIIAGGVGAVTERLIKHFQANGITLWGASAFKSMEHREDADERKENCLLWAQIAERYGMTGVVATGWSRNNSNELQRTPIDSNLDLLVYAGLVMAGHRKDAYKDAERVLKRAGEWKRFSDSSGATRRMDIMRIESWKKIQMLWEYAAEAKIDPARRENVVAVKNLGYLDSQIASMKQFAAMFTKASAGSMFPVWAKRYTDARILPVVEQRMLLKKNHRA